MHIILASLDVFRISSVGFEEDRGAAEGDLVRCGRPHSRCRDALGHVPSAGRAESISIVIDRLLEILISLIIFLLCLILLHSLNSLASEECHEDFGVKLRSSLTCLRGRGV